MTSPQTEARAIAWRAKAGVLRARGKSNTAHDIGQAAEYLDEAATALSERDATIAAKDAELATLRNAGVNLLDRAERAESSLAEREAEMGREWQPIETAPRAWDKPILAINTRLRGHPPVLVRWNVEPRRGLPDEPHWCDAATAQGNALYFNGNYFDLWMPVPATRTGGQE
ncbi:hypothetical protein [Mesorhizobium sp. CAU 1741]|uniref:hypothetical protein n=1 Tax=Mesorhizobium sp. CAU 1741 TaxID=3140366 RepID=UPI00325B91FD